VTPEQIGLVEQTLDAIKPVFDNLAADFYRRLFEADSSIQAMFTTEPAIQRAKLTAELEQVMRSIRDHDAFLARARTLGRQHEAYGVRPRHYATARAALMAALAGELGDRWTTQVAAAWQAAYDLTSEAMLAAADTAPALSVTRRQHR
jgi:hemoglobin-like flavoprotein